MKTRITAILLFLSLIAPLLVGFGWLQHQKYLVKKAVKKQLIAQTHLDELVTIKLSQTDAQTQLEWEHSKEFEYKDEMYDVVRTDTLGDTLIYHCWWDKEETALNRRLKTLVFDAWHNHPERQKKQEQLQDIFKDLFSKQTENISGGSRQVISPTPAQKTFNLLDTHLPIPSPPPRIG